MHRVVRQGVPLTLSCARGKLDGRSAKLIAEFSLPLPLPALARPCEGCRSSRCFQHGICSIGFRIRPLASAVSPEALMQALGPAQDGPRQAQRPRGPWWLPACPAADPRHPIHPLRKVPPPKALPPPPTHCFQSAEISLPVAPAPARHPRNFRFIAPSPQDDATSATFLTPPATLSSRICR